MKKYKTHKWIDKIEEIEILRETENSVWLKTTERRVNKINDFERIHDTWELAHEHLLTRTQDALDRLRKSVADHSERLAKISAMTKP